MIYYCPNVKYINNMLYKQGSDYIDIVCSITILKQDRILTYTSR